MEPPDLIAKPSPEHDHRVVIDHLSGFHRGSRQILSDDDLEIGSSRDATIHFPADHEPSVTPHHARIRRKHSGFELDALGGAVVRVNGTQVESHMLSSGDLIVVGERGPVIRFRIYGDPSRRFKSIPEALADIRDTARVERTSFPGRVWSFLRHAPNEFLRQTAPWTRILTVSLITLLVLSTVYLGFMSFRLQKDLASQAAVLTMVQENRGPMSNQELEDLRNALEDQLLETIERVEALEDMTEAGQRIVRTFSGSVSLLLGEFGFVDSSGAVLRTLIDAHGRFVRTIDGGFALSVSGNGPPFKSEFTGTAFAIHESGLLLTNRHIVFPWEFDAGSRVLMSRGYRAVMNRLAGYLPGSTESFRVSLTVASDSVDLAILTCEENHAHARPIPLGEQDPSPGDEVFVLGYPTGIRALLARTDARFVSQLLQESDRDFWVVAQRLAEEGHIAPLATSGIVGQVTPTYVVYDAETTHGGSGGPVIGLDGRVVAINSAILNDFGGSNLGVPVAWAQSLLDQVIAEGGAR